MNTKLILVILHGADRDQLIQRLNDAGFRVTEFSSIGGFFRRKHSTLLIGVPSDRVEPALAIIRQQCPTPQSADEHRATIFVMAAAQSVAV